MQYQEQRAYLQESGSKYTTIRMQKKGSYYIHIVNSLKPNKWKDVQHEPVIAFIKQHMQTLLCIFSFHKINILLSILLRLREGKGMQIGDELTGFWSGEH